MALNYDGTNDGLTNTAGSITFTGNAGTIMLWMWTDIVPSNDKMINLASVSPVLYPGGGGVYRSGPI